MKFSDEYASDKLFGEDSDLDDFSSGKEKRSNKGGKKDKFTKNKG